MRRWLVAVVSVLGCLLIAGPAAGESVWGPTRPADSVWGPDGPNARREAVVALVLAQDPRFEHVPAFERQEAAARSYFDQARLLRSGYYRVLGTVASGFSPWMYELRYPANWLVEVTLVGGCVATKDEGVVEDEGVLRFDTAPLPDPCAWRHSWFYRVEPDDTVTLLFEEGDPDPTTAG